MDVSSTDPGGPRTTVTSVWRRARSSSSGVSSGSARQTIEADGRVVSPGFVDNHCHYDAQVVWDPLCTYSCHHGSTTVIIGNCSLALAPVKPEAREKLAGMLSYVEAIPMDVLQAGVPWNWETFPEYMSAIGQRLGVNVGTLVGHSAVRLYAMGEECSDRDATPAELETMRRLVRESLEAGALGLSITRNMNHFDIAGKRIPAACAPESELFALADVLREVGTGVMQCGGGTNPELKDKLLSRISEACGRPIMYNTLLEQARQPGRWKAHLAHVEETVKQGIRAIPLCNPGSIVNRFTMKNCQVFRSMPTWLPILQGADADKLTAYANPAIRAKLREEVDAPLGPDSTFSKRWDLMFVEEPKLAKNRGLRGQAHRRDRAGQGPASARRVPRSGRRGKPGNRVQPWARSTWTPRPSRRSSAARTRWSDSPTAARTCSSTRTSATRPGCSATGCARSRSCRSSTPCGG